MNVHPIGFKPEMIAAILPGTKTQTRRIINPQPMPWGPFNNGKAFTKRAVMRGYTAIGVNVVDQMMGAMRCPYGVAGDRLWVRESVRVVGRSVNGFSYVYSTAHNGKPLNMRLSDVTFKIPAEGKTFGRALPKALARIWLEIVKIRVERVQQITESDAMAEGCTAHSISPARQTFALLWDKINAKRLRWADDPWVWVVDFRMIKPEPGLQFN